MSPSSTSREERGTAGWFLTLANCLAYTSNAKITTSWMVIAYAQPPAHQTLRHRKDGTVKAAARTLCASMYQIPTYTRDYKEESESLSLVHVVWPRKKVLFVFWANFVIRRVVCGVWRRAVSFTDCLYVLSKCLLGIDDHASTLVFNMSSCLLFRSRPSMFSETQAAKNQQVRRWFLRI